MSCPNCQKSTCLGPNKLRDFADWSDLANHLDEDKIVEFVNKWAEHVEARNWHGKNYRERQKRFTVLAKQFLSEDEIEMVKRQAAKGEGRE